MLLDTPAVLLAVGLAVAGFVVVVVVSAVVLRLIGYVLGDGEGPEDDSAGQPSDEPFAPPYDATDELRDHAPDERKPEGPGGSSHDIESTG